MKNKNYIFNTVFFIIFILIFFFFYFKEDKIEVINFSPKEEKKIFNLTKETDSISLAKENKETNKIKKVEPFISLIVSGDNYEIPFIEGDTVYTAMQRLQVENINNFNFKYREYPSLGVFVNEINGIKDGDGRYWFYYINKKEASIGISKYILKEGDIINWELK